VSQNTVGITVKATDQTKPAVESVQRNFEGLKTQLKTVATGFGNVLTSNTVQDLGNKVRSFVGDSIKSASDLNESLNAVNLTFGSSAKQVIEWGRTNAASFGLSQQAFNDLATPLGAMLKNTGMSMQETAKWTIDLTKRASDMASVFNTSVPEAMDAIQAGLRGESDPLEKFGVGLSAAKVEAEALSETGKRTASTLTAQELATARLNLIMKQTSQTQGDFQNTSDGLANSQRIASAEFENAKATLGTALMPVMAKAAGLAGDLAKAFGSMPAGMQQTVLIAGALAGAVALVGGKVMAAKAAFMELTEAAGISNATMAGAAKTMGIVGAALAAIAVVGASLGRTSEGINTVTTALNEYAKTGKTTSEITDNLEIDFRNLDQNGLQGATNSVDRFLEGFTGLLGLDDIGPTIKNSTTRIQELDQSMAAMVSSGNAKQAATDFAALAEQAKAQGMSIDDVKKLFPQYSDALAGVALQTDQATTAAKANTASVADQTKAIDAATNALLGERGALRNLEASYDAATEALKTNGKTLDVHTEKGRANQAALDAIAEAARAESKAITDAGGSQSKANGIMATAEKQFIAVAKSMGMSSGEAKTLADKLFAIPKTVTTTVKADTSQAMSATGQLVDRLVTIQGQLRTIQVLASNANVRESRATGGIVSGGFASGGFVGMAHGGGPRRGRVWVGEHGPELADLPPGTQVHSNPDSERMMSGGGGGNLSVVLEVTAGGSSSFEVFMVEAIRQWVRVRGGNVQTIFGNGG
jgi:hypothetical protein